MATTQSSRSGVSDGLIRVARTLCFVAMTRAIAPRSIAWMRTADCKGSVLITCYSNTNSRGLFTLPPDFFFWKSGRGMQLAGISSPPASNEIHKRTHKPVQTSKTLGNFRPEYTTCCEPMQVSKHSVAVDTPCISLRPTARQLREIALEYASQPSTVAFQILDIDGH